MMTLKTISFCFSACCSVSVNLKLTLHGGKMAATLPGFPPVSHSIWKESTKRNLPPAIFFHPQLPENFHLYLCGLNWITWTNLCGWRRTICRLVWNEVTESNNSDRNRISIPQTDGWVSITFKYIWWLHLGIGRTNIVETISISSIAPLFPTTPLTDEEKGLNR